MKRIVPFLLTLALAAACNTTDSFQYRLFTMGYPKSDGSLLGDDGYKYVFNELPEWNGAKRVVAILDVMKDLGDSTFQATLQSFTTPLYKQPVVVEGEMPDSLGSHPILVSDIWYAGGCLNMSNVMYVRTDGNGKHIINLAFDKGKSTQDTLKFIVKHNYASGFEEGEVEYEYGFYSSFPITALMPKRDSTVIKVSWMWKEGESSTSGKVKI